MYHERIEVVLGAGLLGSFRYPDVESTRTYCEMFRPYGSRIDHARIYPAEAFGKAEELMKTTGVNEWATMDTKVTALGNREHSKESIASSIEQSLEALGVDSIDVFYLHMPDHQVPFEESMQAVNEAYKPCLSDQRREAKHVNSRVQPSDLANCFRSVLWYNK